MRISAFMPVTNSVKRGDTFIEAIKTHLYWADELVVVDGGSTDGTIEKIKEIGDPRIKIETLYWPQEHWSWIEFPNHWNFGLSKCTGDWVAAGESDHIFHENEAKRLRNELMVRMDERIAVCPLDKLQSLRFDQWFSKSKIYYFINKKLYPEICYGFDPHYLTDLCQPIKPDGGNVYGLPRGEAIIEGGKHSNMVHGLGPTLYNYLWTFKTIEMVIRERTLSSEAWNLFKGFSEVHRTHLPKGAEDIEKSVLGQLRGIRTKIVKNIPLELHPKIMQEKIKNELVPGMIGYGLEEAESYYFKNKRSS